MQSLYSAMFRVMLKVNCLLKGQLYKGDIGKRPNPCYMEICYKGSTGIVNFGKGP